MLVGYVRVSTEEQNEARQLVSLEERKVLFLYQIVYAHTPLPSQSSLDGPKPRGNNSASV